MSVAEPASAPLGSLVSSFFFTSSVLRPSASAIAGAISSVFIPSSSVGKGIPALFLCSIFSFLSSDLTLLKYTYDNMVLL